jgi:hypothetical protein
MDVTLRAGALKTPDPARPNRSIHALTLPYPGLPSLQLALETSERVFERTVQVGMERPPDRRQRDAWFDVLATQTWRHTDQGTPAPALVLSLSPRNATELLIVVDEGDNRALPITAARLLLPSWRLRFYRPARPLTLLYGRENLARPRYDLALLGPQVMGAEARELVLEPVEGADGGGESLVTPRFFWVGLGIAALVLVGVIVRLVRGGQSP